jgi:hypothetical protein
LGGNVAGEETGERGLPAAGRTPEDDRRQLTTLDGAAQHRARANGIGLAYEFVQRSGTHAGSERCVSRDGFVGHSEGCLVVHGGTALGHGEMVTILDL